MHARQWKAVSSKMLQTLYYTENRKHMRQTFFCSHRIQLRSQIGSPHIRFMKRVSHTHTSVLIIDSRGLVRGLRWYLVDPLAWNPSGAETKSAREKEHLAVAFWVQVAHTVVYGVWLHLWLVTTVSDKSLKGVSAEMYFLYFHFLLVVDLWHLWTTHDYAMSH